MNLWYKENTVSFTGHRNKDLSKDKKKLLWELHDVIVRHIEEYDCDTFISGGSSGIDLDAARIVLKLKEKYDVNLIIYIPCLNQDKLWGKEDKEIYKNVLEKADLVEYVTKEPYKPYLMQLRNQKMVDDSKYQIAVWNGKESGGTYNCLKYAQKQNKQITIITP